MSYPQQRNGGDNGRQLTVVAGVKEALGSTETKQRINEALMGVMPGGSFAELCIIAASDPKLAACSTVSLVKAFVRCAQIALPPGRDLGLVALIPRQGSVEVMVQWQGHQVLMERVPGIKSVTPKLVHEMDEFSWDEGTETLIHRFDPYATEREFYHPDTPEGQQHGCGLRGGYMVIEHDDGTVKYHHVKASDIHRARLVAKTSNVWKDWFEPMALKTVVNNTWNRRKITYDPAKVGAAALHLGAAEALDREAIDLGKANRRTPAQAVRPQPRALPPTSSGPAPRRRAAPKDVPQPVQPTEVSLPPQPTERMTPSEYGHVQDPASYDHGKDETQIDVYEAIRDVNPRFIASVLGATEPTNASDLSVDEAHEVWQAYSEMQAHTP